MQPLNKQFVDGENKPILCDDIYRVVNNNLLDVISHAQKTYGENILLLPISGASSGGVIFQTKKPAQASVIGLYIAPTNTPKIRTGTIESCRSLMLDEIILDTAQQQIYAGAAINLEQLNQTLAHILGSHFKVLGADLTSYQYAQVGSTFMTGGMGPQRRYFSDSVEQIALYDGEQIRLVSCNQLAGYAGSYGWTGIVTGVCCNYFSLPKNEFAFAIPINSVPKTLARLIDHLSAYTRINIQNNSVQSQQGDSIVLGIEHVTCEAMQPLLKQNTDSSIVRSTRRLAEKCQLANADGLVFINGHSKLDVDDFIYTLVDEKNNDYPTIAGIQLTHTEVFQDAEQMHAVREAVPFFARTHLPDAKFIYKSHTDANIQLNPHNLQNTMEKLWQCNCNYVNNIKNFLAGGGNVRGEIIVYGHLNPTGIDPHNRITLACDEASVFQHARRYVEEMRDRFLIEIHELCQQTNSLFIGGEKSASSESEMFHAFGGPENAPAELYKKYLQQIAQIKKAHRMFRWRALTNYLSPR